MGALGDCEGDPADASELPQRPAGGMTWSSMSGSATVGAPVGLHEGLDDGGQDAHGDMGPDAVLGPMEQRVQLEEVLEC